MKSLYDLIKWVHGVVTTEAELKEALCAKWSTLSDHEPLDLFPETSRMQEVYEKLNSMSIYALVLS